MAISPHCDSCDSALHPIKLIDKAHGQRHTDLEYAPADAARSFWTGRYPIEGKVEAYLCAGCGRIAMFGRSAVEEDDQTGEDEDAATAPLPETTRCFSCGEPILDTADRCPACGWTKRATT
jgi:hypothetical protein